MKIHQSITDDGEVKIQSAKIPAQFIIGGSYTGTPAEITVTIKAINATATVAAMRHDGAHMILFLHRSKRRCRVY